MNPITIINFCDVETYRTWQRHRLGPAYWRGMPTWVWQSAIGTSRSRRRPPMAV